MDFIKIQLQLIKDSEKSSLTHKAFSWHYGLTYHGDLFVTDSHFGIVIPKIKKYVDIATVFGDKPAFTKVDDLLDDRKYNIPYVCTGLREQLGINHNGIEVMYFENSETRERLAVDVRLLKYFDMKTFEDPKFTGLNAKSPLLIYDSNILVGIVLPVKVG